uniref:3-hydroxyisobutyrate dehydrogenase n=1 Tax=Eptatretus burgeri TaxID=7764 RepID=A0A8C4Q371_EPTBU
MPLFSAISFNTLGCLSGPKALSFSFFFLRSRTMASKTPVGFVGLGNMGKPMAQNLLKNGYPVVAMDIFPDSCKELQDSGAQIMDSPLEVAERADRIITMLPSSPNVIDVFTGPTGILKKVKKGSLLIDSSTIDPMVSKEMAKAAEREGAVFMDAPVSGGVGAARSAKLTFMVGGLKDEFHAAKELLACMGATVLYCGEVGTGQVCKMLPFEECTSLFPLARKLSTHVKRNCLWGKRKCGVDSACHPSKVSEMSTSVLVEGHSIGGTAVPQQNDSYLAAQLPYARRRPLISQLWEEQSGHSLWLASQPV